MVYAAGSTAAECEEEVIEAIAGTKCIDTYILGLEPEFFVRPEMQHARIAHET